MFPSRFQSSHQSLPQNQHPSFLQALADVVAVAVMVIAVLVVLVLAVGGLVAVVVVVLVVAAVGRVAVLFAAVAVAGIGMVSEIKLMGSRLVPRGRLLNLVCPGQRCWQLSM